MTPQRMYLLLVGHALAESSPLAPLLRELPHERANRSAALAESGHLDESLLELGISPELASLAARWPASLRPAVARLDRLPATLSFLVPALQVLGWFMLILFFQLFTLLLLRLKVLPALVELQGWQFQGLFNALVVLCCVLALLIPFLALALWVGADRFQASFSWGRMLLRAREASLAAALLESEAPEQLRSGFLRSCKHLAGRAVRVADLDLILESSIAGALLSHQRFVALLRVGGSGVLGLIALGILSGVLLSIARLGVIP